MDDVYTVNGITADGFPDSYAGAYINKNMDLVVLMTESTASTDRSLSAGQIAIMQAAGSDDLVFSTAAFSYSTLVSLMNNIYQYLESNRNGMDGFYIVRYALDDYNNCVVVGLASNTLECRTAFSEIISNSDALVFESADPNGYSLAYATLFPGSPIGTRNGKTASIGYRGLITYNNTPTYGFITAGHAFQHEDEDAVKSTDPNTVYGTVRWLSTSGNVDAAFVASDLEIGDRILFADATLKNSVDVTLAQGRPVAKSGFKTKISTGTVKYISEGVSFDGKNYYDLGVSNYTCDKGDSGGIVYSTRTSNNLIVGICQGKYTIIDNTQYSYFCKALNINRRFGISLYS